MKVLAVVALALALTGCPQGTTVHKVTVIQHEFKATVQGFQDVDLAEFQAEAYDLALHARIEEGIQKVAQGGADLDTALAAGASNATIKVKLDAIYGFLDSILNDGVSGVKNVATKGKLEVALEGIKAIVANAEVLVTP